MIGGIIYNAAMDSEAKPPNIQISRDKIIEEHIRRAKQLVALSGISYIKPTRSKL